MRRLRVRLGVICVAFILVLFINHFYLFIYFFFLLHTVRLEKSKPGILARIQARGRCSSRGSSRGSSPSSSPGLNPGFNVSLSCLQFSFLSPDWLFSCKTITFQKYFWCSRFSRFYCN